MTAAPGTGTLHEFLFRELERLDAVDVTDAEVVRSEIDRARAVCAVGTVAIANARVAMDTMDVCRITGASEPAILGYGRHAGELGDGS